nr:SMC family ATPase [Enterococcus sp. CSURQ0835]
MLPKKIVLENFGPFLHETVDFTLLNELPLFLIGGKTGAGKTTIFDAITYALFGEPSGGVRSVNEFRSTFANSHEATRVLFVFEHQGRTYQIERSPKQRLAKKRSPGFTEKAAKVQFTIFDEGKEARAYSKEKAVAEAVRELLHLNKKQFQQIVMLPQGEFRNFLIAPSSEKEILLRNLFGTESYRAFTEQLKTKKQELDSQCQQVTQKIQQCLEQLPFETGATIAESITVAQTSLADQEAAVVTQQENLDQQKVQLEKKRAAVAAAERLAEKFKAHAIAQQALAALKEELPAIEALKDQITESKKIARLQPLAERLQQLTQTCETLAEQQKMMTAQLKEVAEKRTDWEQAEATFATHAPAWQEKRDQQQQLEQLLPAILQQAQLTQQQTQLNEQIETETVQLTALQQAADAGEKTQRLLKQEVETRPVWQARLDQERDFAHQLNELQSEADQIYQLKETESTQQIQLAVLIEQIAATSNQLTTQEKDYRKVKSQWAALEITRLSQALLPGEPCPVCGSTEHPAPAQQAEFTPQELNALQIQVERLETTIQQLAVKKAAAEKQVQQAQTSFEQQQELRYTRQKEFSFAVIAFRDQLADFYSESEQVPDLERLAQFIQQKTQETETKLDQLTQTAAELKTQEAELVENRRQQTALTATLQAATNDCSELKGKLAALQERVGQLTATEAKAHLAELTTELTRYEQQLETHRQLGQQLEYEQIRQQTTLQQLEQQLAQTQTEQANSQKKLTEELAANQIARSQLNAYEPNELAESEAQLENFTQRYAIFQDRVAQLAQELADQTPPELSTLQAQLTAHVSAVEANQQAVIRQATQLAEQQKIVQQVTRLQQDNESQLAKLAELTQLFQTFNGDNPQKISLERYVLQWYLAEVLQSANQQLASLTNGRYQFELNQATGSYKGQTGLEINLFDDNAGASRSAHSLSGGESFIAALALALGLAEVIQTQAGGVAIDALFIDEGFGSLDEEALQMAIDALEGIENKGRMIGIISHVRELKERIPQQILVNTSGTGQSTIDYRLEGWSEDR